MGITAYLPNQDPVFISSWKGFGAFAEALKTLGAAQFPTILDQLPDGDEGETSPEKAALMLQELDVFVAQQSNIQQAVLVDTERGGDISMGSYMQTGALSIDRARGYALGFDEGGFFVRDRWEMNRVLFQAMRVEQRLLDAETLEVEFVDLESGQTFRCHMPFGKPLPNEDDKPRMVLQRFHVELRPTRPTRFAYIVNPLKAVLQASVESSSAIAWG